MAGFINQVSIKYAALAEYLEDPVRTHAKAL